VNPIAIRSRKLVTVLRGTLGLLGVLVFLVGVLFVGQGTNVIHGSSMSGHGGYAVLGGVLVVIGLALVTWAWRLRSRRGA
jgi:protein-S-isoprenylcysteine O-methyltransferase Ste14